LDVLLSAFALAAEIRRGRRILNKKSNLRSIQLGNLRVPLEHRFNKIKKKGG
jgi:hypothetical protein